MAMTPYSGDTSVIGKLGTTPQERGLTTQQFKDKFDEGLKAFVEWFNLTHKTEFEAVQTDIATHKADNVTDSDGAHGLKVERGTFTPTIIGLTTTGDNTYSINSGFYEKIGRTVFFHIYIVMTAKDPAMEGVVYIAGLPFVAYPQADRHNSVSISTYSNIVTAGKQLGGYIQDNNATIQLLLSGDNIGVSNLSASDINNNTMIRLSGIYQTD